MHASSEGSHTEFNGTFSLSLYEDCSFSNADHYPKEVKNALSVSLETIIDIGQKAEGRQF